MLRTENKQAIIISGETGAGKTESTRLLVEFLAAVNQTDGSLVTKQVHIYIMYQKRKTNINNHKNKKNMYTKSKRGELKNERNKDKQDEVIQNVYKIKLVNIN